MEWPPEGSDSAARGVAKRCGQLGRDTGVLCPPGAMGNPCVASELAIPLDHPSVTTLPPPLLIVLQPRRLGRAVAGSISSRHPNGTDVDPTLSLGASVSAESPNAWPSTPVPSVWHEETDPARAFQPFPFARGSGGDIATAVRSRGWSSGAKVVSGGRRSPLCVAPGLPALRMATPPYRCLPSARVPTPQTEYIHKGPAPQAQRRQQGTWAASPSIPRLSTPLGR